MKTQTETFTLPGHQNIEDFIDDLEKEMSVVLMARKIDDTVNGYVDAEQTTKNEEKITIVTVNLYQEDEIAEKSHSSLDPMLNSVIDGLPVAKRKEARDKLTIVMGGHSTNLKRSTNVVKKLETIRNWRVVK